MDSTKSDREVLNLNYNIYFMLFVTTLGLKRICVYKLSAIHRQILLVTTRRGCT